MDREIVLESDMYVFTVDDIGKRFLMVNSDKSYIAVRLTNLTVDNKQVELLFTGNLNSIWKDNGTFKKEELKRIIL